MSEQQDRRRLPQPAVIRFPFKVPRHPAGEPLPPAEDVFGFQIRACIDVSGVDDGLYGCLPDADAVSGWSWQKLAAAPPPLQYIETHPLFLDEVILTDQSSSPFTIGAGQYPFLTDTSGATHVRLITTLVFGGAAGSYITLYVSGIDGTPAISEVSSSLRIPLDVAGSVDTGWIALDAGFRDSAVSLYMVAAGGNNTNDPEIQSLSLLIRRTVE